MHPVLTHIDFTYCGCHTLEWTKTPDILQVIVTLHHSQPSSAARRPTSESPPCGSHIASTRVQMSSIQPGTNDWPEKSAQNRRGGVEVAPLKGAKQANRSRIPHISRLGWLGSRLSAPFSLAWILPLARSQGVLVA
jgi:hypothetical protein